jgi:hypothetical protein
LIVREVPVEPVDLVLRREIEQLLDELDRIEVPTDVEQQPAIAEARMVGDLESRQLDRRFELKRQ